MFLLGILFLETQSKTFIFFFCLSTNGCWRSHAQIFLSVAVFISSPIFKCRPLIFLNQDSCFPPTPRLPLIFPFSIFYSVNNSLSFPILWRISSMVIVNPRHFEYATICQIFKGLQSIEHHCLHSPS